MTLKKRKTLMWVLAVLLLLCFALWLAHTLVRHFSVNYPAPIPPAPPGTIRVACVGDSTTYGMFLWNRSDNCYPAKLQQLLGDDYAVRNFGANSVTVLSTGDYPFQNHNTFALSEAFQPNIVFIMLGTNDAKPENWTDSGSFYSDYAALVRYYKALPSAPQVVLLTPPAVIPKNESGKAAYNISLTALGQICDAIQQVAREEDTGFVDIAALTGGHPEYFFSIDGVHPNRAGTTAIANALYQTIGTL